MGRPGRRVVSFGSCRVSAARQDPDPSLPLGSELPLLPHADGVGAWSRWSE